MTVLMAGIVCSRTPPVMPFRKRKYNTDAKVEKEQRCELCVLVLILTLMISSTVFLTCCIYFNMNIYKIIVPRCWQA
jgi:hypothetical protein